jgi:hypothetical protein
MLRATGLAVVVLGLWLSQAQAAEPPLFAAYKAICHDTRADPQKAVAALGPGWSDAPVPQAAPEARQVHRVKTVGAERWELLLVERVLPKGSDQSTFAKRMRICILSTSARATGLKGQVSALMGAPPNGQPAEGAASWTYADAAAGRQYFSSGTAAETNARIAKAPLVIVMVGETAQGDVAGFTEVSAIAE